MAPFPVGSAIGFRLDSLLKLTDTRARNNKMTLMHYLCKVNFLILSNTGSYILQAHRNSISVCIFLPFFLFFP